MASTRGQPPVSAHALSRSCLEAFDSRPDTNADEYWTPSIPHMSRSVLERNPGRFGRTLEPVNLDALISMGLMQLPLGVVIVDAELRAVWVNEAPERLSDGPPAMRRRRRRLGEVLPGWDVGLIERSLRRVLA